MLYGLVAMRTLFHLPIHAPSRLLRIVLAEKRLEVDLRVEKIWEQRDEFLALNPAGEVPVLVDADGVTLADPAVAVEYLDEVYPDPPLIGAEPLTRAEVRRLANWFTKVFAAEVTDALVGEKLLKRLYHLGQPNSETIRAGLSRVGYHMEYIGYLAETRRWLAGEALSLADLAAAAQISCLDYIGNVPWDDHPEAKLWYARMKSRPSIRPLLEDLVPSAPPPPHYADLDF